MTFASASSSSCRAHGTVGDPESRNSAGELPRRQIFQTAVRPPLDVLLFPGSDFERALSRSGDEADGSRRGSSRLV
jgi:hypothetical protein